MPEQTPIDLVRRLEFVERKRAVLQRRLSQKFSEEDSLVWSIADLMTLLLIFFVMLYARSGGGLLAEAVKVPLNGEGALAFAAVPPPPETQQLAALVFTNPHEDQAGLWSVANVRQPSSIELTQGSATPQRPAPETPANALPEKSARRPAEVDSLQLANVVDFQLGSAPVTLEPVDVKAESGGLQEDVRCFLEDNRDRDIDVRWEKDRAIFVLGERITFHVGSAELREDFLDTLGKIANLIVTRENYEVAVSGHTDDTPIRSRQFPSNWELSAIRAINVAKFLGLSGVNPQQLYVQGFSEYRPQKANDSAENRQANRRVEIALINRPPKT